MNNSWFAHCSESRAPVKFRENTAMRLRVTVRKLNVTDRQTDRHRQTDGISISPVPGLRRGR